MSGPARDVVGVLRQPRTIALAVLAVVLAVACLQLASWQRDRMRSEDAKADVFRENVVADPVDVSALVGPDEPLPDGDEWRAATATGVYDAEAQVLVRNRAQNRQNGLVVAAPLRTADGVWLWVARGWVPAGGAATALVEAPPPPSGTVTVTGIVRPSEDAQDVDPATLPPGQVAALDTAGTEAALGGPVYDVILQADGEDPAPATALQPVAPPAGVGGGLQNLSYMLQWATFAIIAIVGFFLIVRLEVLRTREEGEPSGGASSADGTAAERVEEQRLL